MKSPWFVDSEGKVQLLAALPVSGYEVIQKEGFTEISLLAPPDGEPGRLILDTYVLHDGNLYDPPGNPETLADFIGARDEVTNWASSLQDNFTLEVSDDSDFGPIVDVERDGVLDDLQDLMTEFGEASKAKDNLGSNHEA